MRNNPIFQMIQRHNMPFILSVIVTHTGNNESRERFNRAVWIASTETKAVTFIRTTISNQDKIEIRYRGMADIPQVQTQIWRRVHLATLEAQEAPDQLEIEPIIREQIPEIRDAINHIVITFDDNQSYNRHSEQVIDRAATVLNAFSKSDNPIQK